MFRWHKMIERFLSKLIIKNILLEFSVDRYIIIIKTFLLENILLFYWNFWYISGRKTWLKFLIDSCTKLAMTSAFL